MAKLKLATIVMLPVLVVVGLLWTAMVLVRPILSFPTA